MLITLQGIGQIDTTVGQVLFMQHYGLLANRGRQRRLEQARVELGPVRPRFRLKRRG